MTGEWLLWAAVLLVCPLMMIWMMWMMGGGDSGRGDETTSPANGVGGGDPSSSGTDETAELKQRVADLEAERDRAQEEAGG